LAATWLSLLKPIVNVSIEILVNARIDSLPAVHHDFASGPQVQPG
jgi:hypothetical protein